MTNSKSDIEELKNLQREAAELRVERSKPRIKARPAAAKKSETTQESEAAKPQEQEAAVEEQALETEKAVQDIADQWESVVNKIEDAARKRPVLALLAAFTTGVVVGHILSRR